MLLSTMSVPTVTHGRLRPTMATTVVISTSIQAAGTGTTTIGLTVTPCGQWPKHLQADGGLPSFFASLWSLQMNKSEKTYIKAIMMQENTRETRSLN